MTQLLEAEGREKDESLIEAMLCTASSCPANVMCCTAQQIQLNQLCVSHGWNGLTHRPQLPSAAVTLIK